MPQRTKQQTGLTRTLPMCTFPWRFPLPARIRIRIHIIVHVLSYILCLSRSLLSRSLLGRLLVCTDGRAGVGGALWAEPFAVWDG